MSWVPLVKRVARASNPAPRVGSSGAGHSTGVSGVWTDGRQSRPGWTGSQVVIGTAGGTTLTREELAGATVEIPIAEIRAMMLADKDRLSNVDTTEFPVVGSEESSTSSRKNGPTADVPSSTNSDGVCVIDSTRSNVTRTYAAPAYMVPSRPSTRYHMGNVGRDELGQLGSQ
jgi:hypothetical protein